MRILRVAVCSNLNIDYSAKKKKRALRVILNLLEAQNPDVFLFAGDLSTNKPYFYQNILKFQDLDMHKLAICGNRDLWCTNDYPGLDINCSQSIFKIEDNARMFKKAGFIPLYDTDFLIINNTAFVGTIGWWDYSFRNVNLIENSEIDYKNMTYRGNTLRLDSRLVQKDVSDKVFAKEMNNTFKRKLDIASKQNVDNIVILSHIIPFRNILNYTNELTNDVYHAFRGNQEFSDIILDFNKNSDIKITHSFFGHTKYPCDKMVENIRCIASPLNPIDKLDPQSDSYLTEIEEISKNIIQIFEI